MDAVELIGRLGPEVELASIESGRYHQFETNTGWSVSRSAELVSLF